MSVVPHQPLNGVYARTRFQQMRSKGVPQPMNAAALGDLGAITGGVEHALRRTRSGLVQLDLKVRSVTNNLGAC